MEQQKTDRHLLHFGRSAPGGAVLVHQRAHVAVGPDGGAVHPLPAALLQPLEHLAQLGAHHQRPPQKRLQVVPSYVVARGHDQLPLLAVLLHADGLGLQDAHALHLGHVTEVLHPALHRVHLQGLHAAAAAGDAEEGEVS